MSAAGAAGDPVPPGEPVPPHEPPLVPGDAVPAGVPGGSAAVETLGGGLFVSDSQMVIPEVADVPAGSSSMTARPTPEGGLLVSDSQMVIPEVAEPLVTAITTPNSDGLFATSGEMVVGPASTSSVVARYGSAEQRQILLNAVRQAGSLREAIGLVHAFREMRRLGYQLEDASLHYRGNQGLDLIFSRGGTFAVVEAKAGGPLSSLRTYAGNLRQGSSGYNLSRLQRYLDFGDGTHDAFINHLMSEAAAGRLESFATFYRSGTVFELPLGWPMVPAIPR